MDVKEKLRKETLTGDWKGQSQSKISVRDKIKGATASRGDKYMIFIRAHNSLKGIIPLILCLLMAHFLMIVQRLVIMLCIKLHNLHMENYSLIGLSWMDFPFAWGGQGPVVCKDLLR